MKKFIVNSSVLLNALNTLLKVIEKNPWVPILENFLFEILGETLTITASDLQTSFKLSFRVETNKGENFAFCCPYVITKYLAKIEEQPLEFNYDHESYSIQVLDMDGKAKYSGDNEQDFPKAPVVDTPFMQTNSGLFSEFKDLLRYVTKDQLRPAMTGIGVITDSGKFNMVATNGHFLKVVNVPELNSDKSGLMSEQHFILPAKPAKILTDLKFKEGVKVDVFVKLNEDSERKYFTNVSFRFQYGSFQAELITRNIDEKYPAFMQVLPEESSTKTKFTTDKKSFLKVLDKAELFANKVTHLVKLSLNGTNKLSAEDLDFNHEYNSQIGGTYQGEPIEIGFNSKLLREMIASFGDEFTLDLIAPNKAGVIREGNSLALLMPLRLADKD